jgi:uncharacterized protein YbjT (DUF2867 family)
MDINTVFLTGGTGFLGRCAASALRDAGFSLRALVRPDSRRREGLSSLGAAIIEGDLLDRLAVEDGLEGAGTVVHLAGIIAENRRAGVTFKRIHEEATAQLVEAAWAAGAQRFIYVSALGARQQASSRYHRSKWKAENALRSSGIECVILRPSVIFGPEDEFVNRIARLMETWPLPIVPIVGQGWNKVHPIAVEDVAAMIVKAARGKVEEGTYDLGGPREYSMSELIETVKRVMGRHRLRVHVPMFVLKALAPLMASVLKNPPITADQVLMLSENNVANPNHAKDLLERLTPFEEGIRRYLTA